MIRTIENSAPESKRPHPLLSQLLAPRSRYSQRALERTVAGKTILITGASFGIGRALALKLGRAGAQLLLLARTESRLTELCEQLRTEGHSALPFAVDLSQTGSISAFTDQLDRQGLAPDIVVHNAGRSIRRLLLESLDRAHDFRRTMEVNYLGPVQLQLSLLPKMIERRQGLIVSVSTVSAILPPAPRWSAYSASKLAFDQWIKCAAPELALQGIDCSTVYFGLVHTRMSAPTEHYREMPAQTPEEAADVICRAIVKRPRSIAPFWARMTQPFQLFFGAQLAWFLRHHLRWALQRQELKAPISSELLAPQSEDSEQAPEPARRASAAGQHSSAHHLR